MPSQSKKQALTFHLAAVWQGIVVAAIALLTLTMKLFVHQLSAPNAPIVLFCATIAVGLVLMVVHWPSIFRRLPTLLKVVGYVGIVGYFLQVVLTTGAVSRAWQRTPEGAREYAEQEKQEAEHAAFEAELAAGRAEVEKVEEQRRELKDKVAEYSASLERCFSWRQRLPALEQLVKKELHNPHAFEHVETAVILPDADHNDVAMTFRAENRFGALRTAVIKAQLVPQTCEIASVGEIEEL